MTIKWVPNLYGFTCNVGPFLHAATLLKQTYLHGGTILNPTYKVIIFEKSRLTREERNRPQFRQYYSLEEAKKLAESEIFSIFTRAVNFLK